MRTIPVQVRLDLQALSARYAFRCDTKQYALVGELFTDGGVFDETVIGLPLCEGRAAIHALFTSMDGPVGFVFHMNGNHQVTAYDGATASATCHLHAEGVFHGSAFKILGYYVDDYAREGQWRFRKRKLVAIAPPTGF